MYSATVGSMKKAIMEMLPVLDISIATQAGLTEKIVFSKYLEWSDVSYIDLGFELTGAVGNATIALKKDGATLYTTDVFGTENKYALVTVPAVNKKYGLVEITLDNSDALGTCVLKNLKGYSRG